MDIRETFINLTNRTYPNGHESDLFDLIPSDLDTDEFGNRYKLIGENPTTMFTCHLDTATGVLTDVNHVIEGDIIKTDGKTILGADDKAGVVILMYMIEKKIPGLYYFFLGEEVGCIGSGKVSEIHKKTPSETIKKVVSFDRRGTTSIITHQSSQRCCSDEFGEALANALNASGAEVYDNDTVLSYKNDDTGILTDSYKFIRVYPECTNISVGYYSEHTFSERQDIKHLDKLAKAAVLIDWESLPIKRDPSKYEYRNSGYYGGYYSGLDYEDANWEYSGDSHRPPGRAYTPAVSGAYENSYQDTNWFVDAESDGYVSYVTTNRFTKKVAKADLGPYRIDCETDLIHQMLMTLEIQYSSIKWNGFKLIVEDDSGTSNTQSECDRNDLVEFIPELNFWKKILEDEEKAEKEAKKDLALQALKETFDKEKENFHIVDGNIDEEDDWSLYAG